MDPIYMGNSRLHQESHPVLGSFIEQEGTLWYRIRNFDSMVPFFMSITNPDDIWMFISSTGGITCGREQADKALFPYATVDKINDSHTSTGSLTAFIVQREEKRFLWQPLRPGRPGVYETERNLWKAAYGECVKFEEINRTLGLAFTVSWEGSPRYGIHRACALENLQESPVSVTFLDGMRNIMPAGASAHTQNTLSNLLDAYKRSECDRKTALGIFALSATLTDLAEPSECLVANTVWSYGLERAVLLLSERQVDAFCRGRPLLPEDDIRGERGAYLLSGTLELHPSEMHRWGFCGELQQDHSAVASLRRQLAAGKSALIRSLEEDISRARQRLASILAMNDGLQRTGSRESTVHHAVNVLFNVMRGGYFIDGYNIRRDDFLDFARRWNSVVTARWEQEITALPDTITIDELTAEIEKQQDPHLSRLAYEYLPLTFGRRHGDPSRPWNHFHIRTKGSGGNPLIGYQGNWRDIFQNWEALCISYPLFLPSVITKFLNATTVDGYNPYRISQNGIDWEVPNPADPWGNIGYWSDHQIIYLTKLIEQAHAFLGGTLSARLRNSHYVFANVPYRIKPFEQLLADPGKSISHDRKIEQEIAEAVERIGSDGRLVTDANGEIVTTNFTEKLLILLLAKVTNFVPGGGIWMNTQRPEWNDANNALAGWGLSVVTLCYLIRFITEFLRLLDNQGTITLFRETAAWMRDLSAGLGAYGAAAVEDPEARLQALTALGTAGSAYRESIYMHGFAMEQATLSTEDIEAFLNLCLEHFSATVTATMRDDGTFESYQVLKVTGNSAQIRQLYPMLEGQVAGLSIPGQPAEKSSAVLKQLRVGPLFRTDQHSYMLYPNRDLPRFLEKNTIPKRYNDAIALVVKQNPAAAGIVQCDVSGMWHFNGTFRNSKDLKAAGSALPAAQVAMFADIFEELFRHTEFTGRSGTFFAYEGLGSIYWHMVSKLLLAVQERLIEAVLTNTDIAVRKQLRESYLDIRAGIGFNKSPEIYGAFPTDPYSHTPWGKGAKQPGMTGQVKEEIIARFGELGLVIRNGSIGIVPEIILEDQWDADDSYAFSLCGTQFTVRRGREFAVILHHADGQQTIRSNGTIDPDLSYEIFSRSGIIPAVSVTVPD